MSRSSRILASPRKECKLVRLGSDVETLLSTSASRAPRVSCACVVLSRSRANCANGEFAVLRQVQAPTDRHFFHGLRLRVAGERLTDRPTLYRRPLAGVKQSGSR